MRWAVAIVLCGACSSGASEQAPPPPPPQATCDVPVQPIDTTSATTVVSTCTEAAFRAAVATGGIVTFACGDAPVTITVTSQVEVTGDTTIDGGGKVTLSGGGTSRILHIKSAANLATPTLVVQHLAFTDGYETDVMNTTSTAHGGGAIFEDGGTLTVIDCSFTHNQCAESGQDVSGGAINGQGPGTLTIVGSTFDDNHGSNGGAVGTQDEPVVIVNSTFTNNRATGTTGNPGNGGDGGALSYDGAHIPLTLCGDTFADNTGTASGGAIFRVAYNDEPTTIDRTTFDGNSIGSGNAGAVYLEDTTIDMSGTTISNNTGHYGGGFWIGHAAIVHLTNVTIANNTAEMGAGIWVAGNVTGDFTNVTIASNTGDGLFAGDTGISIANTIIANNTGHNCTAAHADGGHDLAFGAGTTACVAAAVNADPLLGALADNGGPTKTMLPGTGSPAIGAGASCPMIDQRGTTRPTACTIGAVEAP